MNPNKNILFFFKATVFLSLVILTSACADNKEVMDTEAIDLNLTVERFDQDLFEVPKDSIWEYVPHFEDKYNNFFEAYNHQVIKIGGTNQLDYDEKLHFFLTDPYVENSYKDVQKVFSELDFSDDLTNAFKRINYYFPEKPLPKIYTHISGFNQSVIIDSGYISIALDKYLGPKTNYYSMLRISNYIRLNMHPNKIVSDVMLAYLLSEFPANFENASLLDEMIYYGSIYYAMDLILPNTADSLKWGMPNKKIKWCEANERKMWLFMVENKLLFSSDLSVIRRYIEDGPFTATFSKESPARTGQWLGYQIVKSYLKQHPKTTIQQLLLMKDYQNILNTSKYKP